MQTQEQVIREWVFERITLIADNNESWYRSLRRVAGMVEPEPFEFQADPNRVNLDYRPVGEAVIERLKELIGLDLDEGTLTHDLLMDVLDLNDSRLAEELGEHYKRD